MRALLVLTALAVLCGAAEDAEHERVNSELANARNEASKRLRRIDAHGRGRGRLAGGRRRRRRRPAEAARVSSQDPKNKCFATDEWKDAHPDAGDGSCPQISEDECIEHASCKWFNPGGHCDATDEWKASNSGALNACETHTTQGPCQSPCVWKTGVSKAGVSVGNAFCWQAGDQRGGVYEGSTFRRQGGQALKGTGGASTCEKACFEDSTCEVNKYVPATDDCWMWQFEACPTEGDQPLDTQGTSCYFSDRINTRLGCSLPPSGGWPVGYSPAEQKTVPDPEESSAQSAPHGIPDNFRPKFNELFIKLKENYGKYNGELEKEQGDLIKKYNKKLERFTEAFNDVGEIVDLSQAAGDAAKPKIEAQTKDMADTAQREQTAAVETVAETQELVTSYVEKKRIDAEDRLNKWLKGTIKPMAQTVREERRKAMDRINKVFEEAMTKYVKLTGLYARAEQILVAGQAKEERAKEAEDADANKAARDYSKGNKRMEKLIAKVAKFAVNMMEDFTERIKKATFDRKKLKAFTKLDMVKARKDWAAIVNEALSKGLKTSLGRWKGLAKEAYSSFRGAHRENQRRGAIGPPPGKEGLPIERTYSDSLAGLNKLDTTTLPVVQGKFAAKQAQLRKNEAGYTGAVSAARAILSDQLAELLNITNITAFKTNAAELLEGHITAAENAQMDKIHGAVWAMLPLLKSQEQEWENKRASLREDRTTAFNGLYAWQKRLLLYRKLLSTAVERTARAYAQAKQWYAESWELARKDRAAVLPSIDEMRENLTETVGKLADAPDEIAGVADHEAEQLRTNLGNATHPWIDKIAREEEDFYENRTNQRDLLHENLKRLSENSAYVTSLARDVNSIVESVRNSGMLRLTSAVGSLGQYVHESKAKLKRTIHAGVDGMERKVFGETQGAEEHQKELQQKKTIAWQKLTRTAGRDITSTLSQLSDRAAEIRAEMEIAGKKMVNNAQRTLREAGQFEPNLHEVEARLTHLIKQAHAGQLTPGNLVPDPREQRKQWLTTQGQIRSELSALKQDTLERIGSRVNAWIPPRRKELLGLDEEVRKLADGLVGTAAAHVAALAPRVEQAEKDVAELSAKIHRTSASESQWMTHLSNMAGKEAAEGQRLAILQASNAVRRQALVDQKFSDLTEVVQQDVHNLSEKKQAMVQRLVQKAKTETQKVLDTVGLSEEEQEARLKKVDAWLEGNIKFVGESGNGSHAALDLSAKAAEAAEAEVEQRMEDLDVTLQGMQKPLEAAASRRHLQETGNQLRKVDNDLLREARAVGAEFAMELRSKGIQRREAARGIVSLSQPMRKAEQVTTTLLAELSDLENTLSAVTDASVRNFTAHEDNLRAYYGRELEKVNLIKDQHLNLDHDLTLFVNAYRRTLTQWVKLTEQQHDLIQAHYDWWTPREADLNRTRATYQAELLELLQKEHFQLLQQIAGVHDKALKVVDKDKATQAKLADWSESNDKWKDQVLDGLAELEGALTDERAQVNASDAAVKAELSRFNGAEKNAADARMNGMVGELNNALGNLALKTVEPGDAALSPMLEAPTAEDVRDKFRSMQALYVKLAQASNRAFATGDQLAAQRSAESAAQTKKVLKQLMRLSTFSRASALPESALLEERGGDSEAAALGEHAALAARHRLLAARLARLRARAGA